MKLAEPHSSENAERMFWLDGSPRLWAMYHPPRSNALGRCAVFCPPFAEEEKCSRRIYVDLARKLAARGMAVLRFSYAGTADSEGDFSLFRVPQALTDTGRALEWARENTAAAELALVGLRLGGTLALNAAAADVTRIALWAPVTDGRAYVRMNFRRQAIRQMITGGSGAENTPQTFDFDGYPVAQALWSELEGLECMPPAHWRGRVLSLSVGARSSPDVERLTQRMTHAGIAAETGHVAAQPFWNLLGLVSCDEIISRTANWLCGDAS